MRKDPTLTCFLNLLLVGIGQYTWAKGLIILAVGVVLGIFTHGVGIIPVVIWAMYDAYKTAKKKDLSLTKAHVKQI